MLATLNDPMGNPVLQNLSALKPILGSSLNTTQSITLNTNTMGEAQVRFYPWSAGQLQLKHLLINEYRHRLSLFLILNLTIFIPFHSINSVPDNS